MATIKHAHQTVIANDPSKDVSADAWNEAHTVVLVDGDIPASIARDSEVTAAVAAEATARDTAIGVHSADTTAVHGIADTANVVLTNDARLSDARTPTGAAGGDLGGTYPNPTVSDDSHSHTSATLPAAGADLSGVDFLVGTASGLLSAEIPVGTSPGGELGGTWASPTVDATHSGSTHAATQAAAEATAASDATAKANAAQAAAIAASQPLDADLTAIGGLSPSNDDVIQRKAGGWTNRTIAQLVADLGLGSVYQPLDSDLTSIAALTTTSYGRSLLEAANAGALRTLAGSVIGTDVEAHDADLTTIAGLSATNDDILQRKAGAWVNRTIAQLLTDLAAAGTTFQPLDSDLTSIAALTTTSFGRGLLALADAAALAANHTHTGGGLALSVLGYNTVGASDESLTVQRQYMKKITTAAAGLIVSVDLYIDATATDPASVIGYVLTDNAGLPELVMGQGSTSQIGLVGTNGYRWFSIPVGVPIPAAGDYWIGFVWTLIGASGMRIKYDAGSDRYFTIGAFSLDGNHTTTNDSTRKYSFRANFLS